MHMHRGLALLHRVRRLTGLGWLPDTAGPDFGLRPLVPGRIHRLPSPRARHWRDVDLVRHPSQALATKGRRNGRRRHRRRALDRVGNAASPTPLRTRCTSPDADSRALSQVHRPAGVRSLQVSSSPVCPCQVRRVCVGTPGRRVSGSRRRRWLNWLRRPRRPAGTH